MSSFVHGKAVFVQPRERFALLEVPHGCFLGFAKIPGALEKGSYGNEVKVWIAATPLLPARVG